MSNDEREVEIGVRLLTLSDCDYCAWLKSDLSKEGIIYTNIDADEYSDFSRQVEMKFQTRLYPIIFVELKNTIITIVPETNLATSDTLRTFNTIPELIGMIKSYIK